MSRKNSNGKRNKQKIIKKKRVSESQVHGQVDQAPQRSGKLKIRKESYASYNTFNSEILY